MYGNRGEPTDKNYDYYEQGGGRVEIRRVGLEVLTATTVKMSSRLLRLVVWKKFTDVSEVKNKIKKTKVKKKTKSQRNKLKNPKSQK
jgi:hypothetical protein